MRGYEFGGESGSLLINYSPSIGFLPSRGSLRVFVFREDFTLPPSP